MNRRGFLGLVAGLPFAMQLDLSEWQRVILPYRMLIKTRTKYLQAPGVLEAKYNANYWRWEFKAEKLDIHQTMTATGGVLLCPKGQVIGEADFRSYVPTRRGDGLIVTYSLGAPPNASLEEVVNFYKKNGVKCES